MERGKWSKASTGNKLPPAGMKAFDAKPRAVNRIPPPAVPAVPAFPAFPDIPWFSPKGGFEAIAFSNKQGTPVIYEAKLRKDLSNQQGIKFPWTRVGCALPVRHA